MNYKNILAVALLVALVGVFSLIQTKPWQTFAAVNTSEATFSTSTPYLANNTVLCDTQGVLDSLYVAGVNTGYVWVIDATSTIHTDFATTSALLASLNVGTGTSTIPFGVQANRGILVSYTGTGTTTITYTCLQ